MAKPQKEEQQIQYLVRVSNTDLDGKKQIQYAMNKIKGIGITLAGAMCLVAQVEPTKKAGLLTPQEVERLNGVIKSPLKSGIPVWMLNRRKDPESGEDRHVVLADLDFVKQNDIKMLSKMKSYRGLRHQWKLPVRGQRTKSNFRRSKNKSAAAAKKGRRS